MARQKPTELNQRQAIFIKEYQIDFDATRAARAAGYSTNGAHVTGHKLLKNPLIKAELNKSLERISKSVDVSVNRILQELCSIAFFDIKKVMNWNETSISFVPSEQIDEMSSRAISDIKETVTVHGGSRGLRSHDKIRALELLGKYIGMFKDDEKDNLKKATHEEIIDMIEKRKADNGP